MEVYLIDYSLLMGDSKIDMFILFYLVMGFELICALFMH